MIANVPPRPMPDSRVEISLEAIRRNTSMFKSMLAPGCRLMAVVKADGYGHGAIQSAQAALRAGADYLGVAFADEALRLREAGIAAPVLVLGYTPPAFVESAVRRGITMTVFDKDVLLEAISVCERTGRSARIHIKIDTGMSRLGATSFSEAYALVELALSCRFIEIEGIFTHFAEADAEDPGLARAPYHRFMAILDDLERHHVRIPIRHCCNSAATIRHPDMHLDMVRVGISLYGLYPSPHTKQSDCPLIPAMRFKSRIASVQDVPAREDIAPPRRLAVIPVGFANGLGHRESDSAGCVLLHDMQAPIIDVDGLHRTLLDVTAIPEAAPGDEVLLFGCTSADSLPVELAAAWMNTINYEVVCRIGQRVPRYYLPSEPAVPMPPDLLSASSASPTSSSMPPTD